MNALDEATEQLASELGVAVEALFPFTGLHDWDHAELPSRLRRCIADLASGNDDIAAEACMSVMVALWPHCSPEDVGQPEWWSTPLGRLCARSLGRTDAETITHAVAAAMLAVHRSYIGVLVSRGRLDRHPDGGVLRASVLQRIAAT